MRTVGLQVQFVGETVSQMVPCCSDLNDPLPICTFRQHRWWSALCLWGACLALGVGSAEAAEITRVAVGFDGYYKSGYWTPVRIDVQAGANPFQGTVEVVMPDGDGVATRFRWSADPPVELAAGEQRTIVRLVKLGRARDSLRVELKSGEAIAASFDWHAAAGKPPVAAERALLLTLGPSSRLRETVEKSSRQQGLPLVGELSSPEQLPEQWLGWEAVDTLVLTTTNLETLRAVRPPQWTALREWITQGGRLIWSVGQNGNELLGKDGLLASWSPGSYRDVSRLRSGSPLESYSGSSERLDIEGVSPGGLPLTVLEVKDGRVELVDSAPGSSRPLVVRSSVGLGQSTWVAVDLDHPALAQWEGRDRLLNRLLQSAGSEADRPSQFAAGTQVSRFGYQDMVGQLRSGLDQFSSVRFVGFAWVAVLVSVYILLIGPVDYFFLRDVVGRMTGTWVTFPLITAAFVGLAIWWGPRWKGSELLINQVDLVDVDTLTQRVRGTTWAHLYSGQSATYELAATVSTEMAGVTRPQGNVLSWQGLPGTGLGGLDTAAAAPPALDECQLEFLAAPQQTTPANSKAPPVQAVMHRVPVHVAATKSILDRWWGELDLAATSSLTMDADGLLRGEVANPLPVELSECILYFEPWAYRLDSRQGVLRPGERTRVELERALNLHWRLTGRRVVDSKDVSTPWDQHTLVIPRILEMMMFHAAAGGESYTQLIHRYQSYVDLSPVLAARRAILIGKASAVGTQLVLDGQPATPRDHWTYYRIVLPVQIPPGK